MNVGTGTAVGFVHLFLEPLFGVIFFLGANAFGPGRALPCGNIAEIRRNNKFSIVVKAPEMELAKGWTEEFKRIRSQVDSETLSVLK